MPSMNFCDFVVDVPGDWQDKSIVSLRAPESSNGFRRNITVTKHPRKGRDLKAAINDFRTDLVKQGLPDLRLIGQKDIKVDEQPAIEFEFHHTVKKEEESEPLSLVRKQIAVIKDTHVFNITYSDAAASWSEHKSEYDDMIRGIKLP